MAKFWKFNEDTCIFERCDRQAANASDLPVILNDDCDVYVQIDGKTQRWPSGEPLTVAGVQFNREKYE